MLKVFISSTTKDLTEYRDEVIQQLDRMLFWPLFRHALPGRETLYYTTRV